MASVQSPRREEDKITIVEVYKGEKVMIFVYLLIISHLSELTFTGTIWPHSI